MFVFWNIWHALFSSDQHFQISPFYYVLVDKRIEVWVTNSIFINLQKVILNTKRSLSTNSYSCYAQFSTPHKICLQDTCLKMKT